MTSDLLLLTGLEPDLAWSAFSSAVAEIAVHFKIEQLVTFGSVPAAVPHTLPPPILTTASDPSLLAGDMRPPEGLLRVPAAAVSIIDQRVADNGIPTVGFFAQVPHYITGGYPPGVLALVRRLGTHLGLELPVSLLEEEARAHREQLDEVVAEQPEAQQHISTLESMQADQPMVSGEELASRDRALPAQLPARRPGRFRTGGLVVLVPLVRPAPRLVHPPLVEVHSLRRESVVLIRSREGGVGLQRLGFL